MLRSREVAAELGNESLTVTTTRGCPQGGVISPLLWLLVMDDLLGRLGEAGFDSQAYADDLVIMIGGKFDSTISERTQMAVDLVGDWCQSKGLNLSPNKTTIVLFTNRRKVNFRPPAVGGTSISVSNETKYLGVILDSKLSLNSHLSYITNKAIRTFYACKRLFGRKWGLGSKMILWLYKSIIRPMITYASLIWWPKIGQETAKRTLTKVQRLICLSATGA